MHGFGKRAHISRVTLERDLGEFATRALFRRHLPLGSKIPAYEKLKVGDVILSRHKRPNFFSRQVTAAQLDRGHNAEDASWTHAMLYVGDLHVVESHKSVRLKAGVMVSDLLRYCKDCDLLVLRHSDTAFSDYRRQDIVRYGLLMPSIRPRRFDGFRTFSIWCGCRLGFHLPSRLSIERIICSEFILECFAAGGAYMTESHVALREPGNHGAAFLPADLAKEPNFQKIDMEYYELVADE